MTTRTWVFSLSVLVAFLQPAHGQTCLITNPAQPFSASISRITNSVTLTWGPTCTNFAFGVFSTDQLTSNTQWQSRAGMWGSLSGTSQYTDSAVTNRARFYKILRIQPTSTSDWDGDGIPDVFELQYGLNPFDPGDATNDLDGDGYSNFDEFLMGTDPTNPNDPITMYVDSTNFSTNPIPNGTQSNPFRQIQDAIDSTNVPPSGHLAIRVRPGTYYEAPSNIRTTDSAERQFLYLYAANSDWSLSTDPEGHVIDSLGVYVTTDSASFSPTITFDPAVLQARINGFTIRGGLGDVGGIECIAPSGTVVISNCIIDRNGQASSVAGGIYLDALTNSWIYNTVVANNLGEIGGILDLAGVRIWNCTIESNVTSASIVGGVYGYAAPSYVRNCIVWANGLDLYNVDADFSDVGVYDSNSVVYGTHNLTNDPIIVNVANANYRLQTNSPVFGVGTSLPIEQRDLYGNSRPLTGSFDIGANQYKDSLGSGMQDDWEIKNGLSTAVNQGSLDPDGDGLNNLQEYNLGTNPNNPDTDGDGIPDNLDSHPTAAELTIFTSFSDYFRLNSWALYVDGVHSDQWTYLPPSDPTRVVFKNWHVGDHHNFQFELISAAIGTPIVPFLIPPQQFENMQYGCFSVVPDLNDAPALVVTMFPGVLSAPWYFTVTQTSFTNTLGVCAGFDDETPLITLPIYINPYLAVPQNGTNTVSVIINPTNVASQIIFQSSDTNVATVTPAQATGSPQLISVAGSTGGNDITGTVVTVSGYGAQNSWTTECSQVNIDVLPMRTNVTVAPHLIIASTMTGNPPAGMPSSSVLKSYLDTVYGIQANVFMTVLPGTTNTVNYDLDENGALSIDGSTGTLTTEESAIRSAVSTPGAINIYYVNVLTNVASSGPNAGATYVGITYPSIKATFIQDVHQQSNQNLTAHEIGYSLGLSTVGPGFPYSSGHIDRLMWYQEDASDPCRLIHTEWYQVNEGLKP